MTLPSSGAISLSQIQTEFGGSNPISLSEYYGGGAFVPSGITGSGGAIPASGSPQLMSRFRDNGFRALVAGGYYASAPNILATTTHINIMGGSLSNFGNMGTTRRAGYTFGSSTRFLACGGYVTSLGATTTTIESTLFATTGSYSAFGNAFQTVGYVQSGSNRTRGIGFGGWNATFGYDYSSIISYKDLTTSGASSSFGLLVQQRTGGMGSTGASTPTRCFVVLGHISSYMTTLEWVTTATLGNATVYGSTDSGRGEHGTFCSQTRAIYGGGAIPENVITIRYFEMSTSSAIAAFGNLAVAKAQVSGASAGPRGFFCGGWNGSVYITAVEYVTIAATGNSSAFGNLSTGAQELMSNGNGHGGLM